MSYDDSDTELVEVITNLESKQVKIRVLKVLGDHSTSNMNGRGVFGVLTKSLLRSAFRGYVDQIRKI